MSIKEREIEQQLDSAGFRYTSGRRAVVDAMARADGPLSAAELHDEMNGSLPLSSLYRSLSVLEESGVLEPHHGARGLTRYELAESLAGHHHHLICVGCGAVEDVVLADGVESQLEGLVSAITAGSSFRAGGHSLEVDGYCERCT